MTRSVVRWPAANARRLAQHGLARPFPEGTDPATVAAATSGVHAQILSAAEVSAALRVEGGTRVDVRRALWEDRTLVKTFGPRGTVHLLPSADLGRWMAALGAIPWRSPFPDEVRLSPEQTDAVVAAVGEALRDRELTVDELTEAVGELAGPWAAEPVMPAFQTMWPRWRQAVGTAAHAGVLCYGPDRARKVTYTHPARWTGEQRPVDADEAVAWLVEQYLRSYGPATSASLRPVGRGAAGLGRRADGGAPRTGPRGPRRRAGLGPAGRAGRPPGRRRGAVAAVLRRVRRGQPAAAPALPGPRGASGPWCRRARPATTPCCWWTASWQASGTRSVRVAASP